MHTLEARTILAALCMGLPVNPFLYAHRTWLILARYRRRFDH